MVCVNVMARLFPREPKRKRWDRRLSKRMRKGLGLNRYQWQWFCFVAGGLIGFGLALLFSAQG